ncbi:MAG: ImmA/IrrE family metallo-endopeptidase [Acidobacteria bacterium]|nr:ImmA/IrrE family metallo-endopeptidase [Acidobacteriota bacterium]
MDRVIRRLLTCGIEGTFLQEEWAAIQAADQDESRFCKTAAGLGWDPYDLDDSQRRTVLDLDGALDEAVFDEAVAVLDVAHLEANVAAIQAALAPGNCTDLPLDHIRAVRATLAPLTDGNPWEAGYALARELRQRLGLDGEPLRNTETLSEALRERPAQLVDATRPRDFGAAELLNGVVTLNDDGLPAFAFRQGPETSRRFHFCRGLAEVVASPGSPALLTQARSERQQRGRAFAAEFLAPAETLRAKVRRPVLAEEDVDDLAAEFGVSPSLIAHQLQNHEIARIW